MILDYCKHNTITGAIDFPDDTHDYLALKGPNELIIGPFREIPLNIRSSTHSLNLEMLHQFKEHLGFSLSVHCAVEKVG